MIFTTVKNSLSRCYSIATSEISTNKFFLNSLKYFYQLKTLKDYIF